ncbi:MAG: Gfo/Idh/MocA family protein [Methyloligellaceae bacterium]
MINAGIVGLGWWGQMLVNSVQGQSDKVKFTKGMVRNPDKVAEFTGEKRIEMVPTYDDLLKDDSVDAIVAVIPHSLHEDHVIAAAKAGKHIFVEKPFTLTKATAENAVSAVNDANVVLGIGHNRRFHPFMSNIKDKIYNGELGTLIHCDAILTVPLGFATPAESWRARPDESPAGAFTGLGIHLVDAMIGLFGEVEEVYCQSLKRVVSIDTEDSTSVLMKMKNGMSASFIASLVGPFKYQFTVIGSDGIATISKPTFEDFEWVPREGDAATENLPGYNTLKAELEAFADSITDGVPFPVTHDEIIHGISVLEASVKSAASGQAQKVA